MDAGWPIIGWRHLTHERNPPNQHAGRKIAAMRRALIAALIVTVATPPAARAYVPEITPERTAEAAVERVLRTPAARGPVPGIVLTRGGHVLVSRNADQPFVPASLMKLATTTALTLRYRAGHRFETTVAASGSGNRVEELFFIGGGDPTLSTEAYRRRRYLPKPTDRIQLPAFESGSPTVEDLAAQVRATGITRVGDIVADESRFDSRRTQPGWLDSYTDFDPDVAFLSALTVNEARRDLAGLRLAPNPPKAAARRLRTALRDAGVEVTGSIRVGAATASAVRVARVQSPPIDEIIDFINRYSVNFPTEILLKNLGADVNSAGTTTAGVAAVRAALDELGIPLDGFVMTDGSGLSVDDRMTPLTVARILEVIQQRRGAKWRALRNSIPVAGGPGTLLNRMLGAPTGGNLRGKTGQIRMVRAMAGWVRAADGVPITYVAVFNRAPSPFALTGPLDLLGLLVAWLPFRERGDA